MSYYSEETIRVALGDVSGTLHVHKFGSVPAMSQNTTGTIWDKNDTLYPWSSFDTSGTINVPAVTAGDNGKTIRIEGLDENYLPLSHDVTVSDTVLTPVSGTWSRVYRAYVTGGATNVGDINVQKDAVDVLRITANKGQTLMAIYTVPAGKTALILKGTASIQKGGDAEIDMMVRQGGQLGFRVGHSFEVAEGTQYTYDFAIPIRIPQKSDIDLRASTRTNNARVTAAFDILLIDN